MSYHITKDDKTGNWYITGTGIFVSDVKRMFEEDVAINDIRDKFKHQLVACPYCGWKRESEVVICEKCNGDMSKPSVEQIEAAIDW